LSVFQVIPAARLELGALDDVSECEDDVGTKLGIDVFGQEFPNVRSVLRVAAVVAEQFLVRPTYCVQRRNLPTFNELPHIPIG